MKKKKIKASWKEYFNFTAREKRGTAFLAIILLSQIIVLFYLKNKNDRLLTGEEGLREGLAVVPEDTLAESKVHKPDTLFYFNPNQLPDSAWAMLGLRKQQVAMINKYLQKGGRFDKAEDFAKLYCITPEEYRRLSPYIRIPETAYNIQAFKHSEHKSIRTVTKAIRVDISKADSTELETLPGIGPVFASRIVRYRERLGGFIAMNQLMEVYGITDSLFQRLSQRIYLSDTIPFRNIRLNTDSFNILSGHPYVKYEIAKLICAYRQQHHGFKSVDELKEIPLVNGENFRKLAAYAKPE